MKNPLNLINTFWSRKNLPLLLTIGLTVFLLFVFGSDQFDREESTDRNLVDELYSATLKPLFSSNNIDKKDVLTFAVKGDLKLDENNRVLQVGKDNEGKETLEIIKNKENIKNDDYSLIVDKLQLDEEKKIEFDAILKSYQEDLSDLVYYGDDSLIAVDPKIGQLRNSINYDLSTFIKKTKYNVVDLRPLDEKREQRLYEARSVPEMNMPRHYIVFTPDSILREEFHFVDPNLNHLELQHKIEISETPKSIESVEHDRFKIEIDSNFARVTLNEKYNEYQDLDDLNLFNLVFDSVQNDIKLSLEIIEDSTENIRFKFDYSDSLHNNLRYEMSSDDLESAISNSLKLFSGKDIDEWIEYGIQMDSISRAMDSLEHANRKRDN